MFQEEQVSKFNDLDFTIYNFILHHSDKIAYMTIRELAMEAHVSTASITRFCHKVDCDGFVEFKVRFKMLLNAENKVAFDHDITEIEDFLNRVKTVEFEQDLENVAKVLADAKNLVFIGTGNSGVMAIYAARYFSSIGKFALHVDNPMFQVTLENPKDSVFVVFSVEGEMLNLVDNLGILKASGVTLVSITNSKNSSIAKISDYNIASYVQRERNTNMLFQSKVDVTTQVPVLFLIETLAKEVYKIKQST